MRVLAVLAVAAALGASPAAAEREPHRLSVPSISQLAERTALRRARRQEAAESPPAEQKSATPKGASQATEADDEDAAQGPDSVQVLEQEVRDLKVRAISLEDDKQALVNTVQQVMRTNSTMEIKRQLDEVVSMKAALEVRCAAERKELQARVNETTQGCAAKVQAARDDKESNEEVSQALREQNMELQDTVAQLQAEQAAMKKELHKVTADRDDLMNSLHSVLRKAANPPTPKPQAAATVRHEKRPQSHHKRPKHSNGTNSSQPAEVDWNDPVQVMGETKEISSYLAKVSAEDAVEKAADEARKAQEPKPKKMQGWLDSPDSALSADTLASGKSGPSPLDLIAPTTTPAPPAAAADADDGVSNLLREAEDSAGGLSADDSADDAADSALVQEDDA